MKAHVGSSTRESATDYVRLMGETEEMNQRYVAVIGPADADEAVREAAREVGRMLAERGAVVVCGGLGGVMDAAAQGAREAGGVAVGILPGIDRAGASAHLTVAIATGLGEARNALVVRAADAVIAVGGSWGTLSEVALAMRTGVPVVSLRGWSVPAGSGPPEAQSAVEAVDAVLPR
jgi:uncharacterized protein (TIGR00725 family)